MRALARAAAVSLSGLAVACEPVDVPTPEPEESAPYAWDATPDDLGAPSSVEAIRARLQQAIDSVRSFHATPIVAAYQVAMGAQEPGCPTYYGLGEFTYWYDDCATSGGSAFYGYTFFTEQPDTPDYQHDGMSIWGSSTITLADGRLFHLGGRVALAAASGMDESVWTSRVQGTFAWDGEEADGNWLGEGYGLELEMVAATLADGSGGRAMQIQGGIDGFAPPLSTVRFEGVDLVDTGMELPEGCVHEATGVIAVRDDAGRWYEVAFQGAQGDPEDPGRCDGCGTLTRQGETLGEVCLDFDALVAWGDEGPW